MRVSRRLFCAAAPLSQLLEWCSRSEFSKAAEFAENNWFQPDAPLLTVAQQPAAARDIALVLIRVYTALGKLDKIRQVMSTAVRDLAPCGMCNAALFDSYLEMLGKRKHFSKDDVCYVLKLMEEHGVQRTPQTYLYLIEMHIRMGYDPMGVWMEMREQFDTSEVLGATARALFFHVFPVTQDKRFAMEIMQSVLRTDRLEKQQLVDAVISWMGSPDVAPEHSLWLLFELEQRCVLDRTSLTSHIQKHHVATLLLRCAQCGDEMSTEKLLAFMDRHVIQKTADILALSVWAFAQAEAVKRAFEALELMSRKGYMDGVDVFKPYTIEALRYTMDKHFVVSLAEALRTPVLVEEALSVLRSRRERKLSVSIQSLDTIVLALAKRGDEERAVQILDEFSSFGVQPRTASYNCALLAAVGSSKTSSHRDIFEKMHRASVQPNAHTFRLLIRQAVNANDIDEAVRYLELVPSFQGVRVEIEMVLPILERAARAGDVATVNLISKFSLDSDLGVDTVVLNNVKQLLLNQRCDTATFESHFALHETLRSRSKAARRRTKYDVGL